MLPNSSIQRIEKLKEAERPTRHLKAAPESSIGALNKQPSRSIPPPERPGRVQAATTPQSDDVGGSSVDVVPGYTYSWLEPGEIRLLRLHPGQPDDKISCSLLVDSVSAPCAYKALSYTWGDCTATRRISLSDEDDSAGFTVKKPFNVGINLYDALHTLRLRYRPLVLWVDAVCIDQSDDVEKCAQVGLMKTIFSKAHRVVMWLGVPDHHSNCALSNVHDLLRFEERYLFSFSLSYHGGDNLTDLCQSLNSSVLCTAFAHFFSRPYWSRAWVLQEVALAAQATVVCGREQVELKDLIDASRVLKFLHTYDATVSEYDWSGFEQASTLLRMGKDVSGSRWPALGKFREMCETTIVKLVLRFRGSQATDPRDKIYALLSLADDGSSVIPDYSKSALGVFKDFVGRAITQENFLDLILIPWAPVKHGKKVYGPRSTHDEHVPSWIASLDDLPYGWPHEGKKPGTPRLNGELLAGSSAGYNASNNMAPTAHLGPLVNKSCRTTDGQAHAIAQPDDQVHSSPDMVLHVDGLRLGTITDVSTRMTDGLVSQDALEMAGLTFTEGCEALQGTPGATLRRLWQTLVADRDDSGEPATVRFVRSTAFRHLLKRMPQLRSLDTLELLEDEDDVDTRAFLERVRDTTWNRRLFLSRDNGFQETLLGLATRGIRVGDTIVVLFGLSVPAILRPSSIGGGGYMEIVGEAYVDGKMGGEIVHQLGEAKVKELAETFEIV